MGTAYLIANAVLLTLVLSLLCYGVMYDDENMLFASAIALIVFFAVAIFGGIILDKSETSGIETPDCACCCECCEKGET